MISLITTLKNRANLLWWGLEGIIRQDYWDKSRQNIELNVSDGGSTDGLDEVLLEVSKSPHIARVNKYLIDKSKSVHTHLYNCPAEDYNILVKLCSNDIIIKFDPEAVLIDDGFLSEAIEIVEERPAIVMPFPYHCTYFSFDSFGELLAGWEEHSHYTHITPENAHQENVYYLCVFNRSNYIALGGVDERFSVGIGSEDVHFLKQWERYHGSGSRISLLDKKVVHLYHGEWGEGILPDEAWRWVQYNEQIGQHLRDTFPNEGLEWGRLYGHLRTTVFLDGKIIK
jgi:hypothetical protein